MVTFNSTKEENTLILAVCDRLEGMGEIVAGTLVILGVYIPQYSRMDILMSLSAATSASKIDFEKLLTSGDEDFLHDVFGIVNHVDHDTGKLVDFVPRCCRQ